LGTLADDAGEWPMRSGEQVEDTSQDASRFSRVFSRFVRIRHDDDTLAAREPTLARSLLRIDLHAATAAWLAREQDDYKAALQRARNDIVASFDGNAAPVQAALTEIDRLAAQPIAPPLPVLGAALKELRDLRANRALSRQSPEPMPIPAVEPTTEPVVPAQAESEPVAPVTDPNNGGTP
ncbi:MAG: uroporphyrinogen-III C-methyltransferase, partial [Dokdonella sp.]